MIGFFFAKNPQKTNYKKLRGANPTVQPQPIVELNP